MARRELSPKGQEPPEFGTTRVRGNARLAEELVQRVKRPTGRHQRAEAASGSSLHAHKAAPLAFNLIVPVPSTILGAASRRLDDLRQTVTVPRSRKVKPLPAVQAASASLDRWEQWIDELEDHPLDFFEYEALLLHREGLDDELEVAGDAEAFSRADELDSRFDLLTVEVSDSPFAQGSDGRAKQGRWWTRLAASAESRDYALIR